MSTASIMLSLIGAEICGTEIGEDIKKEISPAALEPLYKLSLAHDMAHVVASALIKLGALGEDEISAKFQRAQMVAIFRYERINYELSQLCELLENEHIAFIPLKGSVIRKYYPEPWMRTSCDIDVLVHTNDLDAAVNALSLKLGYRFEKKSSHDISLFSQGDVHVELHYDLVEDYMIDVSDKILSDVWEYASPVKDKQFHMELDDPAFYTYHIAHMAKHVEEGGCGVRTFLDTWILNHRLPFDKAARSTALKKARLDVFDMHATALSEAWFSGEAHTDITKRLEEFILHGGVYGTVQNRVLIKQGRVGGKLQYWFFRIFPPYNSIKHSYPVLEKHKWLLPVCYVRRFFRIIFGGRAKASVNELKVNSSMSKEQADASFALRRDLGLTK